MKSVGKIIIYILILLLLVGSIGIIFVFTNGGTTEFKTFYLQRGTTLYTKDSGDYVFPTGEELTFDVHYMFGFLSSDDTTKDYIACRLALRSFPNSKLLWLDF